MSARVNLLPREIEERARARKTSSWAIGAVAAYAALLGLLYIGKLGALDQARGERDEAQARVDALQQELVTLQEFEDLDNQVTARNQLLSAAMQTELSWARVLNDLALTFPPSSSLLSLNAQAADAAATGAAGTAPANPNADAIGTIAFEGYSVERFAPGVERVLVKFDEVPTFFNPYLAEATEQERSETDVTAFTGTVQLNDQAYTNRYADGLPPEVGQ